MELRSGQVSKVLRHLTDGTRRKMAGFRILDRKSAPKRAFSIGQGFMQPDPRSARLCDVQ